MNRKTAKIDSLNLRAKQMKFDSSNYSVEVVKSIGIFNPELWLQTFGKSLKRNIVEASILHTHLGLDISLKTYSTNKQFTTIEFAGLQRYNEKSNLLQVQFKELEDQLFNSFISRVDICIDYEKRIPPKIIKSICKNRQMLQYKNTTYFKTNSEKKQNNTIDIKLYNKAKKEGLDFPLHRLEFCFKGAYFNSTKLLHLESIFPKMEKSIKKFTGLNVKIDPISNT